MQRNFCLFHKILQNYQSKNDTTKFYEIHDLRIYLIVNDQLKLPRHTNHLFFF